MKSYEEIVREARLTESSKILTNAAPRHAKILISNLFQAAIDHKENVKIVTGCLDCSVYDSELSVSAKHVLEAGLRMDVIVTEVDADELHDNSFCQAIKDAGAKIHFAANEFDEISHFVLIGDRRYRLEPDPKRINAIASFNDQSTGGTIARIFDVALDALRLPTQIQAST